MPRRFPLAPLLPAFCALMILATSAFALAADATEDISGSDPAARLAKVLETEQMLDEELRRMALDAGQGVNFTLAAGQGLRAEILWKLVKFYRDALAKDPANPLAAAGLARVLAALGRGDDSMAAYNRALAISPGDKRLKSEMESLRLSRAPRLRAGFFHGVTREYWPSYERHVYRVHETTWQVQADTPVDQLWRLGAGYLQGRLRQESIIYGDDDFDLSRSGVFLTGQYQPRPDLSLRFRLRREIFKNDNAESYYQMPDDQELWTGYGLLQYSSGPWWTNLSASRERDTWPMVDPKTGRGVLRLEAQELYGLAAGRSLGLGWEANASVFYEQYGSDRPDQVNINGQVLHRPAWLPELRLGLGMGHYTEEPETLINWLTGWQWTPFKGVALDLSWQWEYSKKESSILGMGSALLSWQVTPAFGVTCVASYGQEHNGDRDEWWTLDVGMELRF